MSVPWVAGDLIVRREILRGHPWVGYAARVVADTPDLLAIFLPSGSELGFGEWQPGQAEHPWKAAGQRAWSGHGKLVLHRPDDAYAVELSWRGPEREFEGWKILLQEPIRRTHRGFDTLSHELDFAMAPDGSWKQLGTERFEQRVTEGRYTAEEASQIRATAAGVKSMLSWRNHWWGPEWATWVPQPGWTATSLPAGWSGRSGEAKAAG